MLLKNVSIVKKCGINRNMGCIEISFSNIIHIFKSAINRNMGCIEIAIDIVLLPFVNDKP